MKQLPSPSEFKKLSLDPNILWPYKFKAFFHGHEKLQALLEYASGQGFSVRFENKVFGGWAFGSFSAKRKRIYINLRQPNGQFWPLADVAFILAHEVRHIQHSVEGLYKSYYVRPDKSSFICAIAAERDCDVFAKWYLQIHFENDKSILRDRIYPSWRVDPKCLPDGPRLERWLIDAEYQRRAEKRKSRV